MEKSKWSGVVRRAFRLLCFLTMMMLVMAKSKRKVATDKSGIMQLRHGAFKCLGALLSRRDILTCCTCVSVIKFPNECAQDEAPPPGYTLRAIDPGNITLKTSDHTVAKAQQVTIHPQCDLDGTFDYAIVKIGKKHNSEDSEDSYLVSSKLGKTVGTAKMYSMNPKVVTKRLEKHEGICILHTIFDDDPERLVVKVPTIFTNWHYCWNGSETKQTFCSKYCIKSVDERPISEAKSGSPVYCEGKLVGILARRYALGGRAYCAVNGLDGALDFIKDTINLDLRETNEEEQDDIRDMIKKSKRKSKENLGVQIRKLRQ